MVNLIVIKNTHNNVVVSAGKNLSYNVWEEMYAWCEENFGYEERINGGVWETTFTRSNEDLFHFNNPNHATMFLLRWS